VSSAARNAGPDVHPIVTGLIDNFAGRNRVDEVEAQPCAG
jgi:hypothetical protein